MENKRELREDVERAARRMAQSGKFKNLLEIEAALMMQGHSVVVLQDADIRAELDLLLTEEGRQHPELVVLKAKIAAIDKELMAIESRMLNGEDDPAASYETTALVNNLRAAHTRLRRETERLDLE